MSTFKTSPITSAWQVESSPLLPPQLPPPQKLCDVDPRSAATKWTDSFRTLIQTFNKDNLADCFLEESYWRDQLCLSWDLRTLHGKDKYFSVVSEAGSFRIKSIALDTSSEIRLPAVTALIPGGEIDIVTAFLKVETIFGTGVGLVRLVPDNNKWKAFTLFTSLRELHGHPERTGAARPYSLQGEFNGDGRSWQEQRLKADELATEKHLPVLIIGEFQA